MRQSANPSLREHSWGHEHALAGHGEEQPQDLAPTALIFLGCCNCCIAAHSALPYCVRDLGPSSLLFWGMLLSWDRHSRKEQEINQSIDELFSQGLRVLEGVGIW